MEIINRSKFEIIFCGRYVSYAFSYNMNWEESPFSVPCNIYLKIEENLILIKKVTEFCDKIIIKDSLIENEVEIEIFK